MLYTEGPGDDDEEWEEARESKNREEDPRVNKRE
jgi:hypothetical protein